MVARDGGDDEGAFVTVLVGLAMVDEANGLLPLAMMFHNR